MNEPGRSLSIKKSPFHSQELDTTILSKHIFRVLGMRHHQWRSQDKILAGAKSFDFRPAAVICKQVNSFLSGEYFVI